MTCVIPAADIIKVFNHPELIAMREKAEQTLEQLGLNKPGPKPEKSVPRATDENPNHREDFTSLANAAARKQKLDE